MPFNLAKRYPELLEIGHFSPRDRKKSLMGVFKRDIEENVGFNFRKKNIRPTKKEGESPMETLFGHLTTKNDKDENGRTLKSRSFEMARSIRLHWVKTRIEEKKNEGVKVFSYEDRVDGKDKIRTYILDTKEQYVVILEPQRSGLDYYLLTAYYIDEKAGKKQMKTKLKRKLDEIY
jgi:hypothetical protein